MQIVTLIDLFRLRNSVYNESVREIQHAEKHVNVLAKYYMFEKTTNFLNKELMSN